MDAKLFALIDAETHDQIFAWGMEVSYEKSDQEETTRTAVVYHHDPRTGQGAVGRHSSAVSARDTWSLVVPLDLTWDVEIWEAATYCKRTKNPDKDSTN